jgi:hypothetical protein
MHNDSLILGMIYVRCLPFLPPVAECDCCLTESHLMLLFHSRFKPSIQTIHANLITMYNIVYNRIYTRLLLTSCCSMKMYTASEGLMSAANWD